MFHGPIFLHWHSFLAQEQAELQKKYDALKAEVDKRDADIKQLQRSLKEAETILVCIVPSSINLLH